MRRLLFSFFLSFISINSTAAISDISKIFRETPTLEGLNVCFGGGCAEIRHISIDVQEWAKVETIFALKTDDAILESQQIANAIGILETIVGAKIGTSGDRAGTFNNSKFPGQLDCNDEAINTTTYMHLMQHYGLIKLHEAEDMRTRSFFFNGWPHSTAVMHEKVTGKRFAVDSWFYDNGVAATIVPFEVWKSGYIPDESPIRKQ
ncbi:MAG: hypothetical protein PSV17_09775 [Methylotenera sp.]|uniref:hypothetical protein n=1 Tax=Methylotenera sp. TaxID=2051956 RepID=UPI0024872044|nr:hypothetical protein [Methylotenera sp.]MDI1309705.1 hypothetical protein [Methylotenera sp.]